jgi:hypothetical protein
LPRRLAARTSIGHEQHVRFTSTPERGTAGRLQGQTAGFIPICAPSSRCVQKLSTEFFPYVRILEMIASSVRT